MKFGAAAILALPSVILVMMYGQSRIFFVMARDGLLPLGLARLNPKTGTPVVLTIATGVIAAVIAGFVPLGDIAAVANAGTLCAFVATLVCMMILRVRDPGRPRAFRTPLWWLVGPLAIAGCVYLFISLPDVTHLWFFGASAVGINLNGTAPFAGPWLAQFLSGGPEIGPDTLPKFYAMHMLLIPGLLIPLIGIHIYLVTRLGVSSPPWSGEAAGRERPPVQPTGARAGLVRGSGGD